MGFFSSLLQPRQNVAFQEGFWTGFTSRSSSGKSVNVTSALQVTAVLACVRAIAEGVAQVPMRLHKERDDGGSDIAKKHPLYRVLNRKPNAWQTSFEFRETMIYHAALTRRFVAFKNRVRGQIVELIPLDPGSVEVICSDRGVLTYLVTGATGEQKEFPAEAIWHVKGPSWNGWDGMDILSLARDAIGLSMATEESHALMHKNGGQTSGIYSVEGSLDDKQYKQLRDWIDLQITGANKFKPFILDRGGKWTPTSKTGVDNQHLDTRKHQLEEICRAWRVSPIMIGHADKTATYASAEQMFLAHVVHCLMPWYRRIEESADVNLLTEDDYENGIYAKLSPNALMRGATKDRAEYYYKLWQMGALNPNEIRAMEEKNPYPGGEIYRVPMNTIAADDESEPALSPSPSSRRNRLNVGRVLSSKNERRIRDADGLLNEVLAELDKQEDPNEETTD
ncbi:MAG TPA: phage portal protein [Burkholderiales bacterium]|jgi:HK97 family phage portal protein|nr:phage portal protein [Burkholderiales bacterium]